MEELYSFFPQKSYPLVAAGSDHTVAVTMDGQLYTWGGGGDGQLGTGTPQTEILPVHIPLPHNDEAVISIAAGSYHTVAVTVDGKLYAWGNNRRGRLGTGTTQNELHPVHIPFPQAVASVAAGGFYTVAVTVDGQLYTWGYGR